VYKAELEKKTGVQSTDEVKKLICRKTFCEKHGMQQKKTAKQDEKVGLSKP
jgi:hypothetical protein